jgi:hypothetical protein
LWLYCLFFHELGLQIYSFPRLLWAMVAAFDLNKLLPHKLDQL